MGGGTGPPGGQVCFCSVGEICLHRHCCMRVEWAALASSGFSGTSDMQAKGWTHSGKTWCGEDSAQLDQAVFTIPFQPEWQRICPVFLFSCMCAQSCLTLLQPHGL